MSPVHVAGEVRRERPLVGHAWGLYAIASEVLGGMLLNGGGRFDAQSVAGVLLFYTIPNVISQVSSPCLRTFSR